MKAFTANGQMEILVQKYSYKTASYTELNRRVMAAKITPKRVSSHREYERFDRASGKDVSAKDWRGSYRYVLLRWRFDGGAWTPTDVGLTDAAVMVKA